MSEKDPHRYDDIIELPRFVSQGREHMSNYDRAAQFAPFDALNGYDEAIEETARTTENELVLGEQEIQELDLKFRIVAEHLKERPLVSIRYFVPDLYKEGGRYEEASIRIKRIDLNSRTIIAEDKRVFDLDYISDIRSEVISAYFNEFSG